MAGFHSQNVRLQEHEGGITLAWIDVAGRSMNVLNQQLRADLNSMLDYISGQPSIKLLTIRSAKNSGFIAGADVAEFTTISGPEDARQLSRQGQDLFNKLAGVRVPTIAMIAGPCLGGGLEFALACDYRLVVDSPRTQIGFPEIELGLLPAWGGTQRLPRKVGIERAIQIILNRRRLNAKEALRCRLADAIAGAEHELADRLQQLIDRALRYPKPIKTRPRLNWKQRLLESNPIGRSLLFRGTERILRRRVPDDMPAPFEALAAIRTGMTEGVEAGLACEREAAARLSLSNASRNLVNLFLQTEKARKLPETKTTDSKAGVQNIGIVGAGIMGAGIAQLAALKGFGVTIQEINEELLAIGVQRITGLLEQAAEKKAVTGKAAREALSLIRGTTTWDGFDKADLVVEAVVEDLKVKRVVFDALRQKARPQAILTTNTSSLLVSDLEKEVAHPERLAGLHFFNPVHKMPLVEVVRTDKTDDSTVNRLKEWAVALGKIPVIVHDSPGFIVNRILMPYLAEATQLLAEGLSADQIDKPMRQFGMPMGPLELLDQVGLDVAAHVARAMRPVAGDRFPPSSIFEQMAERNWLGQKTGAGFYFYRSKRKKMNAGAAALSREHTESDIGAGRGALPLAVRLQEARDRMILLMANEAAMCLSEKLAGDAATIDLAMVLGTGWAPHRGGPLRYALDRGPNKVIQSLSDLAAREGARFEPHPALRDLTAESYNS